jgi:hypothetical protein
MALSVKQTSYFYVMVYDLPGEAYKLLSQLAGLGINLLAFSAVPIGPSHTQLALFPEDDDQLEAEAKRAGIRLDGPHHALLVQGDDELGALAGVHEKLYRANVNVYAATGIADGRGSFGYIIYIRPEQFQAAMEAMEL